MITRNLALMVSRWIGTSNGVSLEICRVTNLDGNKQYIYIWKYLR